MKTVLEQALELLERWSRNTDYDTHRLTRQTGEVIAALKEAMSSQGCEHIKQQPEEARCKSCNGNDGDMPCAYPGENKHGCLRNARMAIKQQGEPVAYFDPLVTDDDKGLSWTSGTFHTEKLYTSAPSIPEGYDLVPREWVDKRYYELLDELSAAPEYKEKQQ